MVETRRLTELVGRLDGLLDVPDGSLLVALSGGADSASLAFLLARAGRSVRCIHVDHDLPASPELEQAAQAVSSAVGLRLDVSRVDVGADPSEARLREARYSALRAGLGPDEWLLTAHTLDDQAETVMMNLLRGTGPAGLAGIPARAGHLARPLLSARRAETRELAALAGLPCVDDPANLDPTLTRNVVRLEVLPRLAARFNPRLSEALARSATLLQADEALLESAVGEVETLVAPDRVAVAVGDLAAVPAQVADRVLRRCLSTVRPPYPGSSSEIDRVRSVLSGEAESAELSGQIVVHRDGPLLVFSSPVRGPASVMVTDLAPGSHLIDGYEIVVERVDRVCRVAPTGLWAAIFDPEASLGARVDDRGRLSIEADGVPAWLPGDRRLGVAWYQPGTSGYLSVLARERSGWTSSP